VGLGTCSEDFSILADGVPTFMNAPVTTIANINPSSIVLTWTGLADTDVENNGRDPVIFYDLQWDSGTNEAEWTSLISGTTKVLTFTHNSPGTVFPSA
jgi:hypothetical protein